MDSEYRGFFLKERIFLADQDTDIGSGDDAADGYDMPRSHQTSKAKLPQTESPKTWSIKDVNIKLTVNKYKHFYNCM